MHNGISKRTLMAARMYVRDTANALGAVKGSPCTITSITEADDGIHIVFSWTGTDGTVATQTAIMPYVAVDKTAREAVETLREDMGEAIDTTVRSINGRKPDSEGNVALPLGVTGVPNTGTPNQVFVTDAEGVPMWDDRKHWLELAAICPEILADPDVKILYNPGKTEVAQQEYWRDTTVVCEYYPNVTSIGESAYQDASNLEAAIFPSATVVGNSAFRGCRNLKYAYFPSLVNAPYSAFNTTGLVHADFPALETISGGWGSAFSICTSLVSVNMPKLTSIESTGAFSGDAKLNKVNFPALEQIAESTFQQCASLKKVDLPKAKNIGKRAFRQSGIEAIILRGETVCALAAADAFDSTPIASGTGYIYVPAALIEDYKAATNWSTYAAQCRAIEDYPEICDPDIDKPITKGEALQMVNEKMASAGSSGGSGVCIVNVSCDADLSTQTFSNATKDKTYAEIKAAYDAGAYLGVRLSYLSGEGITGIRQELPLTAFMEANGMVGFVFSVNAAFAANMVTIMNNDIVAVGID